MINPGGPLRSPGGAIGAPSPKKMTPKQFRAYLRYLSTHHLSGAQKRRYNAKKRRAVARARRVVARAHHKVGLVRPGAASGEWILGGNDLRDSCAAAAVANSLLASTGRRASDQEVVNLHQLADVSIADVLAVTAVRGLADIRPLRCRQLSAGEPLRPGDLLHLDLFEAQRGQDVWDWDLGDSPEWGQHAAVLGVCSVISWGAAIPVTPLFLRYQVAGAWRIWWPGEVQAPRAHQLDFSLPC